MGHVFPGPCHKEADESDERGTRTMIGYDHCEVRRGDTVDCLWWLPTGSPEGSGKCLFQDWLIFMPGPMPTCYFRNRASGVT